MIQTASIQRRTAYGRLALMAILLMQGCTAFRANIKEVAPDDTVPFDAKYDYSDLRTLSRTVGEKALTGPYLQDADTPPVLVVLGIENRTSHHIDMKALSDSIRTVMLASGQVRFVNESRRDELLIEQGYQQVHVTPETRAALRSQLGARYMLTGSLVELKKTSGREARLSKREEIYYQLTIEITDLETSLIAWTTQEERARRARRPLIGW